MSKWAAVARELAPYLVLPVFRAAWVSVQQLSYAFSSVSVGMLVSFLPVVSVIPLGKVLHRHCGHPVASSVVGVIISWSWILFIRKREAIFAAWLQCEKHWGKFTWEATHLDSFDIFDVSHHSVDLFSPSFFTLILKTTFFPYEWRTVLLNFHLFLSDHLHIVSLWCGLVPSTWQMWVCPGSTFSVFILQSLFHVLWIQLCKHFKISIFNSAMFSKLKNDEGTSESSWKWK